MPGAAATPRFQVVILAGGENKKLFPLTSGGVKALLPVGNRPLISYTLRHLEQAGISQAVVVSGPRAAAAARAAPARASTLRCRIQHARQEVAPAAAARRPGPGASAAGHQSPPRGTRAPS